MNSLVQRTSTCCAVLVICGFAAYGQMDQKSVVAVDVIRLINTVEARQSRYLPLEQLPQDELRRASRFYPSNPVKHLALAPGDFMPGYDVRFLLSAEGKTYTLLVQDRQDKNVTFYSDERGLIYRSAPLQ